ncbi:DUF5063 domain-containing protein [Qipengyuania sp.]|uniref:DUF5063 domain-containing protein n=1 Tax=Qipengyuania sp. TaxID=2004515 RepID=UPI003735C40F
MNDVSVIRHAIERFLGQLDRDPTDDQIGLRSLAISLDNLVSVYFTTVDVEPTDGPDAPAMDYSSFARRANRAFPELGSYPYADPGGESGQDELLVADAIDDIADIAGDLSEVLWLLNAGREIDAIWDFRFGYQYHWGDHLHSLRHYLHSTRVAAW